MRILANENFPGDAVMTLRQRGHDVVWVRTDAPGSRDIEILARAQREDRIVVTFDKDFGIVLFRISAPSSAYVVRAAVAALESRTDWAGHFAVVEDHRIRMTPLPPAQSVA